METNSMLPVMRMEQRIAAEPLDCSSTILDLSLRDKNRTTSSYIPKQEDTKHIIYYEPPTSRFGFSSPDSETSEISSSDILYRNRHSRLMQASLSSKVKVPRPFKAYPKDPLSLRTGVVAAECIFSKDSSEAYAEFRKCMLAQVQGTEGITNKNMRRNSTGTNIHNQNDSNYWEKRRKNNEAAKRSRDARRAKEDEIAIRAAFLEQENLKLRYEVAALRNELEKVRSLLYGHSL